MHKKSAPVMFLRRHPIGLLILYLLLLFQAPVYSQEVSYRIEPLYRGDELRLKVNMSISGGIDGQGTIEFADQYGGEYDLFNAIRKIKALSPNLRIRRTDKPTELDLFFTPGQTVRLSYEVIQDRPPGKAGMQHALRPQLNGTYFHLLGLHLFAVPRDWPDYSVQIEWVNFPKSWTLHNTFGFVEGRATQRFTVRSKRWLESVFVGGDFRVLKTELDGSPVYLAVRGNNWDFDDRSLLQNLREIISVQRTFWDSDALSSFTVTLLPLPVEPEMLEEGVRFYQYLGVGLTNSFTAFATPTNAMKMAQLRHLFHHEMLHEWIGNRIRCGQAADDMKYAWFSEGFTEYLAYKNMLRANHIGPYEYIEVINTEFVDELYDSPLGSISNNVLNQRYFVDPDYKDIAYKRGFILAFYLDNALKAQSNHQSSLRDFMLDMLEYYQSGGLNRNLSSYPDFFYETLDDYMQADMSGFLNRYVEQGQLIPSANFRLPPYLVNTSSVSGNPVFRINTNVVGWRALLEK